MSQNLEQAFKNTVIAFKLMSYSYSLAGFFKSEFKKNENEYVIPFSYILYVKRHIFPLIRDTCEYVCPYTVECDGHQFVNLIQRLYEFQSYAVLEKKCFYKDFRFYNFRFKRDKVQDLMKIDGWDFNINNTKDLSKYSYSQRAQYLN